ncbi:MAG: deoxynucleoside kinase [Phototrophicaceae bacterium]
MTFSSLFTQGRFNSASSNCFIGIAGNIGAGKSSLTGLFAERFGWKPFYEANAENPYLEDFYHDMERWSFHSQVFFLGKRLEHHRQLLEHHGDVIQDRTVYEDAEIFARNLYLQGKMSQRDYEAYQNLYHAVSAFLPPPNLMVYLRASTETLMEHITKRGRVFERNIDPNYIAQLNHLYEDWIGRWTVCPILTINMDELDFVAHDHDLETILTLLETTLLPLKHNP